MECFECSGRGCDICDKTGRLEIAGCPQDIIGDDIWSAIEYATLYDKGLPPIAGGALDQAESFLQAARFIQNEKRFWKKKLKILD